MRLDAITLKDHDFVELKLCPNVNLYSGVIYRAIDIPVNMLTGRFAIRRLESGGGAPGCGSEAA